MLYFFLLAAASLSCVTSNILNLQEQTAVVYTNSWAIEIKGGNEVADDIAQRHGFINMGQIGSLTNMYHFLFDINGDHQVKGLKEAGLYYLKSDSLQSEPTVGYVQQQTLHRWEKKYLQPNSYTDPEWGNQWTVNNTGQTGEPDLFLDINAEPAWIQGYTGNGIIVGVVDDGLDHRHTDLRDNYVSRYSYDFNADDRDPSPGTNDNDHGTACAGQIAMTRSNNVCGVGVAYDAKVAGLRLLGNRTTDVTNARALSYERNNIDIYSNSWGPFDYFGFIVHGPGFVTKMAIREGSEMGRAGLGNIFTWAAGNGGQFYDSCAADGFAQSIYSISVGAYNQNGSPAYYDEKCSSKLTVAYVANTLSRDLQTVTLTLDNECTRNFSGTSAATPYVSAVIALTLNANPNLTWRDIQYLIVYTSNRDPLLARTDDHFFNGAGLRVSHQFGMGAIDAEAMVTRAQHWTNVPSQITDTIMPSVTTGMATYGSPLDITFSYSGQIRYLEHIVVTMSLNISEYDKSINVSEAFYIIASDYLNRTLYYDRYRNISKRGDINVTLTSPTGSVSTLLFNRPYDLVNVEGYDNWPFLSVLHWGENPNGQWTVRVNWNNSIIGAAELNNISVTLYGVSNTPVAVSRIPNQCDSACARTRGCAAAGAQFCDACNSALLRNATTRECIQASQCVAPNKIASGYCYVPFMAPFVVPTPSSAWGAIGSKFLIALGIFVVIKLI